MLDAVTLNTEGLTGQELRQLVGCLAVCLRRSYRENT
jgi:hypothetical protein